MKKLSLSILILLLGLVAVNAQSADSVTEILATESVTWGQAAYFTVTARPGTDSSISQDQALLILKAEGWAPKNAEVSKAVNLEQVSFLLAATWNIRGSLWLALEPAPRFTFRQLKADGIITSSLDPHRTCSGHEFLGLVSRCIDTYGIRKSLQQTEGEF